MDFEDLNTNWHPQSSFYLISGTRSFKFLTQTLKNIDASGKKTTKLLPIEIIDTSQNIHETTNLKPNTSAQGRTKWWNPRLALYLKTQLVGFE